MSDVHPPHEASHTWKDFFIHIATITIGLLIADASHERAHLRIQQHCRHNMCRAQLSSKERETALHVSLK